MLIGIAAKIVIHRIHHHGGMILRRPHIKRRVARVIGRSLLRIFPVIIIHMRHGKRDEHADIIRRPENFREPKVLARLAAVVMRVDEIDAERFEPGCIVSHAPSYEAAAVLICALSSGTANR